MGFWGGSGVLCGESFPSFEIWGVLGEGGAAFGVESLDFGGNSWILGWIPGFWGGSLGFLG